MTVRDARGVIIAFKDDEVLAPIFFLRLAKPVLIGKALRTHRHVGTHYDIVLPHLWMQRRCALRQGCRNRHYRLILLIFDLYQAGSSRGCDLILRYDRSDVVAIVMHPPRQQKPVADVLMRRLHTPRMAGSREIILRHIEAGDYLHHARHLGCLIYVHAFHPAVRDSRMHHLRVKDVHRLKIRSVFRFTSDLTISVNALLPLTYRSHIHRPSH